MKHFKFVQQIHKKELTKKKKEQTKQHMIDKIMLTTNKLNSSSK